MAAIRQVAPTPNPTPSKGEGVGKSYLGFEITAIKGFCGVTRVRDMANIWGYFQTTKSSKEHRNMIMGRMKAWAKEHGFKIDPAIFFPLSIVEDIVSLSFNPGECVAIFTSINKGLTPRPVVRVVQQQLRYQRYVKGQRRCWMVTGRLMRPCSSTRATQLRHPEITRICAGCSFPTLG